MRQNTLAALPCPRAYEFFEGRRAPDLRQSQDGRDQASQGGRSFAQRGLRGAGGATRVPSCRPAWRSPKAEGERGGRGKIATAVIAKLRDRQFATLRRANAAIMERLDEHNARPFQKREGSRKLVFGGGGECRCSPRSRQPRSRCATGYGAQGQPGLHVVATARTAAQRPTGRLVGKKVDLKVTESTVEIYGGGERVATNPRIPDFARYKLCRPTGHAAGVRRSGNGTTIACAGGLRRSARLALAVERVFCDVQIKEQAYNP